MNRSLLALAVALGLSAGLHAAYADDANASSSSQPSIRLSEQAAQTPFETPQNDAALQDFRRNINPNTNIPTTGIYDQEDRFEGPTGRPLPGWGSVNGQGAGDN
jgi:hypothetical protein